MTPENLMRSVAKAFERGDLQPLFDVIDDNTVWKTASASKGAFRFHGEYKKRAGIVEVTAQIATMYIFRRFEPREIVARGEIAWGLFDLEAQHVPTGKMVKVEIAIRWQVRDGKLVEHQGFLDTVFLLEQQGGFPPKAGA